MSKKKWALVALCAVWLWSSVAWSGGSWEELMREDGFIISARQSEGQDLPTFRGQGVLRANILEILAVLSDTERNPDWMHKCVEAKMLKQINEQERIIYNRTDAPWPVSDRDVVLQSKLHIDAEKKTVVARFWSISSPLQGPVEDVVRMPRLKGFYRLKVLDKDRTHVTYQVDADPGGSLPDWVVERASRELPLNTLRGLQAQVKKTRGQYKTRIQGWAQKYQGALGVGAKKEK